jgi:hypothetical protein
LGWSTGQRKGMRDGLGCRNRSEERRKHVTENGTGRIKKGLSAGSQWVNCKFYDDDRDPMSLLYGRGTLYQEPISILLISPVDSSASRKGFDESGLICYALLQLTEEWERMVLLDEGKVPGTRNRIWQNRDETRQLLLKLTDYYQWVKGMIQRCKCLFQPMIWCQFVRTIREVQIGAPFHLKIYDKPVSFHSLLCQLVNHAIQATKQRQPTFVRSKYPFPGAIFTHSFLQCEFSKNQFIPPLTRKKQETPILPTPVFLAPIDPPRNRLLKRLHPAASIRTRVSGR